MIRFIYADALEAFPRLSRTMFRDRAVQFKERLDWDVQVNTDGLEIDTYDGLNPLYVIWEMPDGTHGGSMRFLPTVGQTMVNDFFTDLTDGVSIVSPLIWECTRFCISPRHMETAARTAAGLMLAGCELGLRFGLEHSVGVFDARMKRIYRRVGWSPEILGSKGEGRERICVGLWRFSQEAKAAVCRSSGISGERVTGWFEASFPVNVSEMVA
ncbi:MAG: acyl-homoserine-lactone synthase [Paracoccaceae bacterium]